MGEFRMPSLGADMEAGTLVEWLVPPGEEVRRGDILASVETQKGLFEIESFVDGILGEPLVRPGQKVPVGTVMALIHETGVPDLPAEASPQDRAAPKQELASTQAPAGKPAVPPPAPAPAKRIAASPAARKLAAEQRVELGSLCGSGPDGTIQRRDVELAFRAAGGEVVAPAPSNDGMRQAIAAAMTRSNREIPHYYLEVEIDMSQALHWLEAENLKRSIRERLLPAVLLLKAMARALGDVPELNGYWLENRLQMSSAVHIGFAIALRDGGLVTPAIHNVDKLNLHMLMLAMGDLIDRTRSGRLRSSEMTDASITLTNLGDLGVKTAFGVIYPPQVALVAFGRIMERPWAENGMLAVRRCVTATLAADHRATDGHRGSQFLDALNRYLQRPETL